MSEEKYKMEKMNALKLRRYFGFKWHNKFNKSYRSEDLKKDLSLLKRLLNKYSDYVIMEAIDIFVMNTPEERCVIPLFCTTRFFEKNFAEIINNSPVIKYKRMLPLYGRLDTQLAVQRLVTEYEDILHASSQSGEDIERMQTILRQLDIIHQKFVSEGIEEEIGA